MVKSKILRCETRDFFIGSKSQKVKTRAFCSGQATQKVRMFFVSIGRSVRCTIHIAAQIMMEARMKCKPFFCCFAQSRRSSFNVVVDSMVVIIK